MLGSAASVQQRYLGSVQLHWFLQVPFNSLKFSTASESGQVEAAGVPQKACIVLLHANCVRHKGCGVLQQTRGALQRTVGAMQKQVVPCRMSRCRKSSATSQQAGGRLPRVKRCATSSKWRTVAVKHIESQSMQSLSFCCGLLRQPEAGCHHCPVVVG